MKVMQYGGGEGADAGPAAEPGAAVALSTAPAGRPWLWQAALGLSGLLALLALWWLGTEVLAGEHGFARNFSPAATLPVLLSLATTPELWLHVGVSLKRVLVGLALALVVGMPLGLLVGASSRFDSATSPAFQFLRMTSPLSWMPIAIMLFGIGDVPIYFLLAFAAVWPILLNTATGVRQLNPQWLLLGKSLAATRPELLWHVILPGILGHVLTGVRLAIGISWIVLVPCEMLGVQAGLGYFILDSRDRLAYPELMATILVVGITGFALDAFARGASRPFRPGANAFASRARSGGRSTDRLSAWWAKAKPIVRCGWKPDSFGLATLAAR